MKSMLWIGDAACPSGFAKATHNILETLRQYYYVTVLGLNYRGDPHPYPYEIFSAGAGGDGFGIGRLIWMCDYVKDKLGGLDVIVIQNDGWNIPYYVQQLRMKKANGEYAFPEHAQVPIVTIVAVDGKNFDGRWLDGVQHAIFWTQFALDEARAGGYKGPASVIPLGVDEKVFYPMPREEARKRLPKEIRDMFIVGSVNRNQPRKRWDLLIKYFAKWINEEGVRDAYLFLHTAPTGDKGIDAVSLARYYGVVDRLAVVTPEVFYGVSEEVMAQTYNCFDVAVSTTAGEGFGLTTLESMACGVPQQLPGWSALGDWAGDHSCVIPCTATHVGPPYVNVIGGVPDEESFVRNLNLMYRDPQFRAGFADLALKCASDPRYRWENIGAAYLTVLDSLDQDKGQIDQLAKPASFVRV